MLIESTVHLPISLAMFQDIFHRAKQRSFASHPLPLGPLRRRHHLDWPALFFQPGKCSGPERLSIADTKKKVNPDLLGRALWYFRWGAVVTVLVGPGLFRDVHPEARRDQREHDRRRQSQCLV